MSNEEKPNRTYQLVPDKDGKIVAVPSSNREEPDPQPAEDGKYYLREGRKAVEVARRLHAEGVDVYCFRCKAPLTVLGAFIGCSRNQNHFGITFNYGHSGNRPR